MRICSRTAAATLVLLFTVLAPWSATAQTNSDLHGGWIIAEWQAAEGQTGPVPERGLFVFTATGYYSMMYVIGENREALPASPSEADIAAAYGPFVANSGRYMVDGNQINYEAFVAKDPAYMLRFEPTGGEGNMQSFGFSIDDGVLTLEFGDGGPMQGAKATLRRPGSGA